MTDWADDPDMSDAETLRRFRALDPKPTTGPPVRHVGCRHITVSGAVIGGRCPWGCTLYPVALSASALPDPTTTWTAP